MLGVSPDDRRSHLAFREKYSLPFTLLSDPDHAVAEAYGTWVEKTFDGKTFMGVERSTFVIDERGTLVRVMRNVTPADHAADVLDVLRTQTGATQAPATHADERT